MSTSQPNSENELLLSVAHGDETAFRKVVKHYYSRLASYVLDITGSRHVCLFMIFMEPNDVRIYKQIDEILWLEWDPIGVNSFEKLGTSITHISQGCLSSRRMVLIR